MTAIQADALPGLDTIPATPNAGYSIAKTRAPRRQPNPYSHLETPHWRGIRAGWCATCHAPIVTGPDDDWCAAVVRLDVTPLTALGEASLILTGRRTYTLAAGFNAVAQITRRNVAQMRRYIPGKPIRFWHRYDVLPIHECGKAIPESMQTPTMLAPTPATRRAANEPAPF